MNNNAPPQLPRPRTLFGGMAVVATGIAVWWYGILRHQSRKDERGQYTPWEFSILQAQAPVEHEAKLASSRQSDSRPAGSSSSTPKPPTPGMLATHPDIGGADSSLARADKAVPGAPQTKAGKSMDRNVGPKAGPQPTHQRTRDDDGRVYTKAPRYVDDYDAHKKH